MSKKLSIEYIFTWLTGSILFAMMGLLVLICIKSANFVRDHPGSDTGFEGAGMAFFALLFLIPFSLSFFMWQYALWADFSAGGKRRYIQLAVIFLLGIFPFLLHGFNWLLTSVFHMEDPFTEHVWDRLVGLIFGW